MIEAMAFHQWSKVETIVDEQTCTACVAAARSSLALDPELLCRRWASAKIIYVGNKEIMKEKEMFKSRQ